MLCVVRSLERQLFLENEDGERKLEVMKELQEMKKKQLEIADQLANTIRLQDRVKEEEERGLQCSETETSSAFS